VRVCCVMMADDQSDKVDCEDEDEVIEDNVD
jgi:hypothetical protein